MIIALTSIAFVISVWWAGTATVLVLQHRVRHPDSPTVRALLVFTVGLCVIGLGWSAATTHWFALGLAFVAAVALWGCLELSYFLGLITGTHRRPYAGNGGEWQRFRAALSASLWHELSIVLCGAGLILWLWASPNPTGVLAFLVLWLMRWSAKLNLFIGVPHFATDWFPPRMAYLVSYMRRAPVGRFFRLSVTIAGLGLAALVFAATRTEGQSAVVFALPAVLLFLAIIEHLCMALPIADSRLWQSVHHLSTPTRRATS